jgi:hypothetical protein
LSDAHCRPGKVDFKEASDWSPLEHLKASLRDRQLLVLLDNFEQ